jgi:hypothetical protein
MHAVVPDGYLNEDRNLTLFTFRKLNTNLFFMKNSNTLLLAIALFVAIACQPKPENLDMDNFFAWCVVPFDSENRSPEQRIAMLKALGFNAYAYDWRQRHLPEMAHELLLAQENDVAVTAIWMWIDVADSVGQLNPDNEKIFKIIEETGTKTQLWIGISETWLEGLSHDSSMAKSVEMVRYLSERASILGCKIGLYNHGGWFGNPKNQVALIKKIPEQDLGIIFNFHHAHELLAVFPALVDEMKPYLWAVNLNGMKEEGPKILPIGKGDLEQTMIELMKERGYDGPFGILGHVEEADVRVILERNLEGLKSIW